MRDSIVSTSEIAAERLVAPPGPATTAPARPEPAPREAAPRDGARIPALARDVVLVVLGAMLALAADEWRETRQRRERVRVALVGIRDELRANQQRVRTARDKHVRIVDTLQKIQARGALPPPQIYMNGMWNPASVTSAAWEAARETGALADMPMATVLELARVYHAQEDYETLGDGVGVGVMNDVRQFGMEGVLRDRFQQFIPLALDASNRESVMLGRYEQVLARPELK